MTRSSPRKKLATSYREPDESCDGTQPDTCVLVSKAAPSSAQRSKQVRLAPLSTLQSSLASLRLEPATLHSERRRKPRKDSSSSDIKAPTDEKCMVSLPTSSSVASMIEEVKEADIEESVWCGSEAGTESSEDELPSPSKFIRPAAMKSPPIDQTRSAGVDFTLGLKALRISESPQPEIPAPKLKLLSISDSSRPTSSSDKENDHKAILRFSPPRIHSPRKQRTPERTITPPPLSPSKGRLLSPSKRAARVPTPPLRASLDAFWNAETVNDWNDQYSPRKEWKSPKKLKQQSADASASPTASPRKCQSPSKRTKAELGAKKDWEARKHQLAEDFLAELDRTVAGGQIQHLAKSTGGVRFIWSKTLHSTAGRANWKRETTKSRQLDGSRDVVHKHHASIELAEKVIDDENRLLNVVAHEFCHLCNFMLSGVKDQPHGRQFKEWGRKCTVAFGDRGVEVTTKHTYQIDYKYIWQCSNEDCAVEFKRHSKSVDVKRHTCGTCRSQLVQIKPVPRQGGAGGGATGYAGYVKKHFATIKAGMPGASQKLVMEAVGRQYRAEKATALVSAKSSNQVEMDVSDLRTSGPGGEDMEKVARVLEFITLDDD